MKKLLGILALQLFGIIALLFVAVMLGCTTNHSQTQSIAEIMPKEYSDRFIGSKLHKHKAGDHIIFNM
ncbi:hypothetical protein JOD82_002256 [Paenibacillus sp. 1182]|uniref:hypothetical protein n=1 Tax=Paenibacillus sp. 1182 TaxID=2806565 RepID=UPI001AE793C2|nr:hypothetical protein [Paenibacillus sp. 1182]MBP1309236.1 hypothetical protein [Paenibacillus sp. 1182]